jgi:hypothetical protein
MPLDEGGKGSGNKGLKVAKALDAPKSGSSPGFPNIVVNKPSDSGPVRQTKQAAPLEQGDLESRQRRSKVLFIAMIAVGAAAMATLGIIMLVH